MTCCPVTCGRIGWPGGGACPGTHPAGGADGGALRGAPDCGGTPGAREVTVSLLSWWWCVAEERRWGSTLAGEAPAPLGLVDERPLAQLDGAAGYERDGLVPGDGDELVAALGRDERPVLRLPVRDRHVPPDEPHDGVGAGDGPAGVIQPQTANRAGLHLLVDLRLASEDVVVVEVEDRTVVEHEEAQLGPDALALDLGLVEPDPADDAELAVRVGEVAAL